jgi:hypothetical protein
LINRVTVQIKEPEGSVHWGQMCETPLLRVAFGAPAPVTGLPGHAVGGGLYPPHLLQVIPAGFPFFLKGRSWAVALAGVPLCFGCLGITQTARTSLALISLQSVCRFKRGLFSVL